MQKLNQEAAKLGIRFGEFEIGNQVKFLDIKLWIDDEGIIQYKHSRKPTDSRLYLKTQSSHPKHVFDAVAFSQMDRVSRRSSNMDTGKEDVEELKKDLINCGHKKETLEKLEE